MTFDELYDEMLSLEFSTRGRHAKPETIVDPAAAVAAVVADDVCASARHAVADTAEPMSDEVRERPTGLARYRTAALVGAGGLACATVGAFLGGLGGYFTVSPAGAHAVASTSQDSSLADAASHATHATHSAAANAALAAASFSSLAGGLTSSGWGAGSISGAPSPNAPLSGGPLRDVPVLGGSGSGSGSGGSTDGTNSGDTPTTPVPTPAGCSGLACIIDDLTGSLTNIGGNLPGSDPTGLVSTLTPTLDGMLTEITTTLSNLGVLLGSPPAALSGGLPSGGVVPTGLSGLPSPVAGTKGGTTSAPGGIVGTVVNGVTGATSPVTSTAPSLPSAPAPLPGTTTITSIVPTTTSTPTTTTVTAPTTTTTAPTTTSTSTTTVTAPLPISTPTTSVTVGPVTVGTTSTTTSSGSTTGGLTLSLGGL